MRPRATREIEAMQEMIEQLIASRHAYVAGNHDVYFSVRADADYGALSGRDLDQLRAGERVEVSDEKRDPFDFALWKAAKSGEPSWPSPWGDGRPGWHTECCAMIHHYLGTPIDIHGGGQDLIFPHHENETAQARCAWHTPLARTWMHAGMLRVDGEKMSKSLGNFYTLKEVLDKYPANAVRLLMLQTHYRSPLDFRFEFRPSHACASGPRSRRHRRPPRSRSMASAWRRTRACGAGKASTPPTPSICPTRTATTRSGTASVSAAGPPRRDLRQRPWSTRCCARARPGSGGRPGKGRPPPSCAPGAAGQRPRANPVMRPGTAASKPTTSSMPASSGSAMEKPVDVMATTMSRASMPLRSR